MNKETINQFSQFGEASTKLVFTNRKDSTWLNFNNEAKVLER